MQSMDEQQKPVGENTKRQIQSCYFGPRSFGDLKWFAADKLDPTGHFWQSGLGSG